MIYFLLNKTWTASITSHLLESSVSKMFPVRLGAWWLYIVDLLFGEVEDGH